MSITQRLTITLLALQSTLAGQWWTLEKLISDTLQVQLTDSGALAPALARNVLDNRDQGGNYLGIRQIKKLKYIPVDQYFFADYPLADHLDSQITLSPGKTLTIDYLDIWQRDKPYWILNGYSYETDSSGQKTRDWQWDVRIKKIRKEPLEESLKRLVGTWIKDQHTALSSDSHNRLSPRRYRRQIVTWADIVILSDGSTLLDAHLGLPYPKDQLKTYRASIPGMYYRKGRHHESIAIGGLEYQRYTRLTDRWVLRQNGILRGGFNSFNADHFDYIDWWNMFLINIGLTASVEYRPPYLRGFFGGVGLHYTYNIFPEIVTQSAGGLLVSAGLMLP